MAKAARRRNRTAVSLAAVLLTCCIAVPCDASFRTDAVRQAVERAHASLVVLDWKTGAKVISIRADVQASPGSTVKPLLLDYALQHGVVTAGTTVYCKRNLRIAGRAYPCTHPAGQAVFDAQQAIAESCNTWFAAMGRRFSGPQLDDALTSTHLAHSAMALAGVEQRELAALGLRGVIATPESLAHSYLVLLPRLDQKGVVWLGLGDSVEYGMARGARVPGVTLLGKTGTAVDAGQASSHGWFAGGVPGRFILVVYVARGDGGDAARLAGSVVRELIQ